MIRDWREHWGQGDFPFYFCQLPNFMPHRKKPGESQWAELRESQSKALSLPNTGEAGVDRRGRRGRHSSARQARGWPALARLALAKTYGKDIVATGPVFQSMAIERDRVRIHFTSADGRLVAREIPKTYQPSSSSPTIVPLVRNSPSSQLEGFAICGKDHQWKWADAEIDGADVVVWSPQVPHPAAVRYAWADNPICNLYNAHGLPAAPFRTDDFPLATAGARY